MAKRKKISKKNDLSIILYLITMPVTLMAAIFTAMIDWKLVPISLAVWFVAYVIIIPRKI